MHSAELGVIVDQYSHCKCFYTVNVIGRILKWVRSIIVFCKLPLYDSLISG